MRKGDDERTWCRPGYGIDETYYCNDGGSERRASAVHDTKTDI